MPTQLLDTALVCPGSRFVQEKQESLLSSHKEELANLRFSILLTASWEMEARKAEDEDRRDTLHAELIQLRYRYSDKIDEIAMTFGVQSAMSAQDEVECSVEIPFDVDPPVAPGEDCLYF